MGLPEPPLARNGYIAGNGGRGPGPRCYPRSPACRQRDTPEESAHPWRRSGRRGRPAPRRRGPFAALGGAQPARGAGRIGKGALGPSSPAGARQSEEDREPVGVPEPTKGWREQEDSHAAGPQPGARRQFEDGTDHPGRTQKCRVPGFTVSPVEREHTCPAGAPRSRS